MRRFSIVLLGLVLALAYSPNASAWTGNLGDCSAYSAMSWRPPIEENSFVDFDTQQVILGCTDYEETLGYAPGFIIITSPNQKFLFDTVGGQNLLYTDPASGYYIISLSFDSESGSYVYPFDGNGNIAYSANDFQGRNLGGISYIAYPQGQTPLYAPTYTGSDYNGLTDPHPEDNDPQEPDILTDPAGWVKWLVVPQSSYFEDFFTSLTTFMTEKLGFLLYPFEWVLQTVDTLQNDPPGGAGRDDCYLFIDATFFGYEPEGGWNLNIACAMHDLSPAFWNGFTSLIKALTFMGLLAMLYRQYQSVVEAKQ